MAIENLIIKKAEDPLSFTEGLNCLKAIDAENPSEALEQAIALAENSETLESDLYHDALDSNLTGLLDLDDDFAQNPDVFYDVTYFLSRHMPELAAEYFDYKIANLPENVDTGYISELKALSIQQAQQIEKENEATFIANLCSAIPDEGFVSDLFGDQGDVRYTMVTDFAIMDQEKILVTLKDGTNRTVEFREYTSGTAATPVPERNFQEQISVFQQNIIESVPFDPTKDFIPLLQTYNKIESEVMRPEVRQDFLAQAGRSLRMMGLGLETLAAAGVVVSLYKYLSTRDCEGQECDLIDAFKNNLREPIIHLALAPETFEQLVKISYPEAQWVKYLWWYSNIHGYAGGTTDPISDAITKNWQILYFAEPQYTNNPELVRLAAQQNPLALLHAPEELLSGSAFLYSVLGDNIPTDFSNNPAEWIRNLQTVTQLPERFSSLEVIQKLWEEKQNRDNRPLALIINGTSDHNGAGIKQSDGYIVDLMNQGYKVLYYEVSTEQEYADRLDEATSNGDYLIDVLLTFAHGDGKTIALGGQDLRLAQSMEYDEKFYLDISDLDLDASNSTLYLDPWLMSLNSYLKPNTTIILATCLSGATTHYYTQEPIALNVQKMFQLVTKSSSKILGTAGPNSGIDHIDFSKNGNINKVVWNKEAKVQSYSVNGLREK